MEALLTFDQSMLDSKEKIDDIRDPILKNAYIKKITAMSGVYTDVGNNAKKTHIDRILVL